MVKTTILDLPSEVVTSAARKQIVIKKILRKITIQRWR